MASIINNSSCWPKVAFGDVVRNVDETIRDSQNSGLERYVGLEHIDPESLHIQRWGLISEGTSFTRRFRKGQVLFGKRRAYQRKVAVAEFDGLCSSDILVFQPKDDRLLPELLPFICQSDGFFEHALDTSAGSLSPRTKFKELARYKFPLPPLDEQRRIAEILWAADDLFTMWKLTDLKIQLSIKSLISNFLNQKWPLCELAKVGEIVTGATPPTKNSEYYQGGDILFIGPSDFNGNKYIKNAAKKITKRGLDVVRSIPKNAVMVTCIGLIGKVALSDSLCATNQQINSIICNETCDPLFLYFVLSTLTDELNKNASCSVVPILNKSNMATIKIPLPPRKDQIKFLEKIHYFEGTKQNIQNHICILSRLRDSLVNNWF